MKNSQNKSIFSKIRLALLLISPLILFFSYRPIISIGSDSTMNYEFSLPEIWLVLFALVNFFDFKYLKTCLGSFTNKKAKSCVTKYPLAILSLFPLYVTASILWSPNRLRAVLTAGILWLIIFAGINIYHLLKTEKSLKTTLSRGLILSSLFISIFCWIQCFLDLAGLSREQTLLCLGCTHTAFGFPHPNGFAIEPQFLGNLLLAPTLLSLYLLIKKDRQIIPDDNRFSKPFRVLTPFFLTSTLFLTFSRGAIYAFLAAAAILFISQFPVIQSFCKKSRKGKTDNEQRIKADFKRSFLLIPTILGGLAFSLVAQGVFAELSPTSDTFSSGVAKSIHQLTLGKVDLRKQPENSQSDNQLDGAQSDAKSESSQLEPSTPIQPSFTEPEAQEKNTSSTFSGYVEESTSIRLNLTKYALDIWNDQPTNLIFGTGLGSAGIKMYEKFPEELGTPKEIVQNQYASLLLELGLLGILLAVGTVIYIVIIAKVYKSPLFMSVLFAFAITLFFFAGLPNAIHIYLFPFFL